MKPRQRPCGAGCIGDGKSCRQAEVSFKPESKIGQELFLAAEEMRGAFDVEKKAIGTILFAPG